MSEQDPRTPASNLNPHNHSRRIRLGVIGCGAIAEGAHIPAALSSSAVDVTAISDTSESRVRHILRQFGLGPIGTTDYREVFSKVDAVILALPNSLHSRIGKEFLARGIHVLCEKPLAISRRECEEMCEAAKASSAVLAVGFVTRFYPSTELTKQFIESGFLGAIESFDYEFGTAGGWAPLSGYNLSRATSGGGVLVVSGSHFIDRMLFLFCDLELLSYSDDNHGGVEANCVARLRGTIQGRILEGRITLSKTQKLANRLRLVGEKGALEVAEGQSRSVTFFPAGSDVQHEIHTTGTPGANAEPDYFRLQLEDFVNAVRFGMRPRIDGEQGLRSVELTDRCFEIATPLDEPWCMATLERLGQSTRAGHKEVAAL
jgi:predicted dehydrogenase